MEEISRIFLGKYARPKDKINLMGEIMRCEGDSYQKSDEEIKEEVMNRFERLGLKDRIATASYLEDEISSDGFQSMVYFLYRLSLSLDDGEILKQYRSTHDINFSSLINSDRNGLSFVKGNKYERTELPSTDEGCGHSARDDCPSSETRNPSGNFSHEYLPLHKASTRANPMQRECIEVSMSGFSSFVSDALSRKSTFLFTIQDGFVTAQSPLVISNQSISKSRAFLRPILQFINEVLKTEDSLLDIINNRKSDLPSQLCKILLEYLEEIREESVFLFSIRPFPCTQSIKNNIELIMEKIELFISISRKLTQLRNSSCAECIDVLSPFLSHESINDELTMPIINLLRFAIEKTLEEAEWFMLSGEVTELRLIVEIGDGSTLHEPYRGGRIEGERWRKNYGIRVGYGKSIDKTTADEIMAEGKLALMRVRDPSLIAEYSVVNWNVLKEERDEERKRIAMTIQRGVTNEIINQIFKDSIKWIRTCGDRSIFLSKQINLVANSLEIVWQVFLLGDRVTRVPHFDGSMNKRFAEMRDAIAAFPDDHLLAVSYYSKKKGAPHITLQVSGALSIVVSSSNISIYTEAHKLLSKLSQVYHQISQAYLCLPPLSKGCDEILRSLHKGLAEITHWVGKLCGHLCTQVHEVVWKETNKEVLRSLPSFDQIFSIHRKCLKQLATRLFLQSSASSLSSALHSSIDASSDFARNIEGNEWKKAAENYIDFIEAAQMFTHGLMVDEDPFLLRSQLLFLIDPDEKFRM